MQILEENTLIYEEQNWLNVAAEMEGEDLSIAFNPRYLIEALRSIEEDSVKIHFMASLSPCTILPVEGDSFKYLILPLRM